MELLFALGMPGPQELLLILVIVLVLFGAKRLPELARGLGQSMNEFRRAKDEFDRELRSAAPTETTSHPTTPATTTSPTPDKPA